MSTDNNTNEHVNTDNKQDTILTDKNGCNVEVFKDTDRGFFGIRYHDEPKRVGLTDFLDVKGGHNAAKGERIFYHTEIGEEYGGRGLASVLIKDAIRLTQAERLDIVAVCPFVKSWLEKHGEDVVWRKPTPDDHKSLQRVLSE